MAGGQDVPLPGGEGCADQWMLTLGHIVAAHEVSHSTAGAGRPRAPMHSWVQTGGCPTHTMSQSMSSALAPGSVCSVFALILFWLPQERD